jgi:hypothetical protein
LRSQPGGQKSVSARVDPLAQLLQVTKTKLFHSVRSTNVWLRRGGSLSHRISASLLWFCGFRLPQLSRSCISRRRQSVLGSPSNSLAVGRVPMPILRGFASMFIKCDGRFEHRAPVQARQQEPARLAMICHLQSGYRLSIRPAATKMSVDIFSTCSTSRIHFTARSSRSYD